MEYKNELKKLKALVSQDTWECLKEHNAIIAGGAITSVFCNREVNDLDVYFRCEEDFIAFIEDVWGKGEDGRSSHFLIANNMTDRSILFKDKQTEQHVQVIVYKWFESVNDLFKDYDFTVNMGAVSCKDGSFVFHADFLKHNSQRYLSFNEGTAYPLISALRVQKYIEKGYSISKAQMLRLLLAVNAKQIDSWEKLKDEVGGMYGLNMDDVFPEDKEFSLSVAMDTLSSLDYDETYKMGAKTDGLRKEEIYAKVLKGEREDASNKMFKMVCLNEDGTFSSHYNKSFQYKVGETVNGGEHGIWFCQGYDVIGSQYYYHNNSHIIEVEGGEKNEDKWGSGIVLKGDVKVVAGYTKMEFIKKYGYKQEE